MTTFEKLTSVVTRRRDYASFIAIFGVLFYVLRIIGAVWQSNLSLSFPDSFSFRSVADLGPFSTEFWFTERPIGTPLLLWLCGLNTHLFFLLQTLLFALSVVVLCRTLFDLMSSRLVATLTSLVIVALTLHPRFGMWHLEVLSESLSLSLGLLMIALWLRFTQRFEPTHLRRATLVTALWLLTRDAHLTTALIIIVVLAIIAARTNRQGPGPNTMRRSLLRSVTALLLVVTYIVTAQSVSDRNQYPLINNIGQRVLPNQEVTNSFIERGMPFNEALAQRSGSDSWDDDETFLRSPDLADFRSWVNGPGQVAQMRSLIVDAGFWIDHTADVLPSALKYDFVDYDRFETSQRLPERFLWFGGLQSSLSFGLVSVLGLVVGLAMLFVARRRTRGFIVVAGLLAAGLDVHLSVAGDAVEVYRHLVGPILRLSVVGIVACGLGLDWALGRWHARHRTTPRTDTRPSRFRLANALTMSVAALGIFATWVALEYRTQDFDPQYTRTIVERAATYGGTYYQNGIHNKGPLETALYDLARLFTTYESFWLGISVYVIFIAALLGTAARVIARFIGASRLVATTAGILVAIHFSLSSSDYAGVLYSRNITSALLTAVVVAALLDKPWSTPRRATVTFIASGVVLGLAVQTLLTTVLTGIVVATFVIVHRARSTSLRHPVAIMATSASAAVVTAPLWYGLRGSFSEFWSSWWTYAGYMSSGTGRSVLDQFGLGLEKFVGYYQQRPEVLIAVLAFGVISWGEWSGYSRARRRLHITLLMWFIAAWIEVIVAQRYSSHYFSVIAIPSAFMAVIASWTIIEALTNRRLAMQPPRNVSPQRGISYTPILVASCALLTVQGTDLVWAGIEGASSFRNTSTPVEIRNEYQSGSDRTARAVMDLMSTRGDALLAWTMYPWTYLEHERVPATRLIWKSFMIGEIYLGRTSNEYVLNQTWNWFTEDLAESRPQVYARPIETALVDDLPFNGVVDDAFTIAYTGPHLEIGLSRSRWEALLAPTAPMDLTDSQSPLDIAPVNLEEVGWTIDFSDDVAMNIRADQPTERLTIGAGTCRRFDGTLRGRDPALRFQMVDPSGRYKTVHLGLDQTRAWSGSETTRYLDQVLPFESIPSDSMTDLSFSLVIGPQSAALIVGDLIVAAVRLESSVIIALDSDGGDLEIDDLAVRNAPALLGC